MQQIVNAAPTAGEGDRVHGMLSALVAAGIEAGYLTNPRLAMVHWQAGDRPLPAQRVTVSGESALWVDSAEIPSDGDIGKLGRALAVGVHGERDELMANTAAYSGLRWGELTALTVWQVDQAGRVITVDRQVVGVAGHLYVEAPKCRKYRKTIYPRRTPDGYPLAGKLAARIEQPTAEDRESVPRCRPGEAPPGRDFRRRAWSWMSGVPGLLVVDGGPRRSAGPGPACACSVRHPGDGGSQVRSSARRTTRCRSSPRARYPQPTRRTWWGTWSAGTSYPTCCAAPVPSRGRARPQPT